jgi:hypothetical protein
MRVSEMRQPTCRRRLISQRKGGEDERAGKEEIDDCVGPEPAVKAAHESLSRAESDETKTKGMRAARP